MYTPKMFGQWIAKEETGGYCIWIGKNSNRQVGKNF